MTTRSNQLLAYITKISPYAECDDCVAKLLKFPRRQTAYIYGSKLRDEGLVERFKRPCNRCGSTKISTSLLTGVGKKQERSIRQASMASKPFRSVSVGLTDLKSIGFTKVGLWVMDSDLLSLQLFKGGNFKPALYAFVSSGEVLYVGKTSRNLSKRLYHYTRPGPRQSTNIRLNRLLKDALSQNRLLEIFAFGDAVSQHIGPFQYDVPAAIEDDVIRKIKPAWNSRK